MRLPASVFCCAFAALLPLFAFGGLNPDVLPTEGALSRQTMAHLLLADAARVDNRVVAVGDRGYIVYSDDNGATWQRAATPPDLPLLTAVYFGADKTGWAVGHDATILKSTDQGKTWSLAFSAPKEQKPLMDVLFLDANTGFAVGAYGSFYQTTDAGKTWSARKVLGMPAPVAKGGHSESKLPEDDKHLNAIVKLAEGKLLITGEAGTLLRSDDGGKNWVKLVSPYKGSFYGALRADDGATLIYGMRGKIFRSTDAALGKWEPVDNTSLASLIGSTRMPDGALVLTGQAGTVLVSRDQGKSFQPVATGSTRAYAAPVSGGADSLLLVGEAGANSVPLPAAAASLPARK